MVRFQIGWIVMTMCVCVLSCVQLCDPVDCSLLGSVHGIFQARTLEQVAISYSRGSSRPKDQTCISCASCIGRWILYHCATWEASDDNRQHLQVHFFYPYDSTIEVGL
ncbi:unnamed protein product [Rangifer tarandus platyrhynchus]|uniref:Uncharacterized protein n=1 Tax=Rangifer tarandus platyrhynchus TaxID=3082113 RepID=A0AC59ZKJ8_RANTA